MRAGTKIRMGLDMILWEKKNFIFSILLAGTGFLLAGFTLLVFLVANYARISANDVLSQGISHTGTVMVDDCYTDEATAYRRAAAELGDIAGIGAVHYGGYDRTVFPDLYAIQDGNSVNETNPGYLQMLVVDMEALDIGQLEIAEGTAPNALDASDDNVFYLYLGYAYRGIEVGTQYQDGGITYEVAGMLKKDATFLSTELSSYISLATMRCDVNMNYEIVCVSSGMSTYAPWFFAVDKNSDFEAGMQKLEELAEEYGVDTEFTPLEESFEEADEESEILQDILRETLSLFLIVIFVIITVLEVVQVYHMSHRFGIFYAVGFETSDIWQMLMVKNIIYFICSAAIGTCLTIFVGRKCFVDDFQASEVFGRLLFLRVLPVCILLMLAIFAVATAVPCRIFGKMDPAELLKEE
ncbi:MAG: ABC transporter permease [Clostridiales bacterium]|nr:ABC transporter permease [Clostridiales bacterium]